MIFTFTFLASVLFRPKVVYQPKVNHLAALGTNSHPSKNVQCSHNQQLKQTQKQPRATQGHPSKSGINSHNQNNQRQLQ
jgi:hypothetical protein